MTAKIKRGIIQSRGLGDIVIALPIARYYYEQGEEIVWPICSEFYSSVREHAPWVNWVSIDADAQGRFFLDRPLEVFREQGVESANTLYLYQYLNTVPELTNPELFNILKFDQYKYWTAAVPFIKKWTLADCIERDLDREAALREQLTSAGYDLNKPYALLHLTGSSARVEQNLITFLDPAVQLIDIDQHKTDSVFDWWGLLESADAVVCLDSVIANMVDQLCITGPALYWIRRSSWDLTPVLGMPWKIVSTNLPIAEPTRVDPAAQAKIKQQNQGSGAGGLTSHVPFAVNKAGIPTNFMHALKR